MRGTPGSYVVLLPVKPPGRGKSPLGDLPRDDPAAAFATDTAIASLAAPTVRQVLGVTDAA
jgi:2-phospho-L-lactate guanylyltransferase